MEFSSGLWGVQRSQGQGAGTGQLPAGPRIPLGCLLQEAPRDTSFSGVFSAGGQGEQEREVRAGPDASSN